MVWFSVDDNLAYHPKVLKAGNPAMGLWVRAGSWSAANLTDGFIPTRIALAMGSRSMCNSLVQAGLFELCTDGYRFHDWDERQPSKADIEAKRKWERERKAEQRKRKVVPIGVPMGHDDDVPMGLPPDVPEDVPPDVPRGVPRAYPIPSHPISNYVGGVTAVGSESPPPPPPPRYCEEHPYGTRHPCHACQETRQSYEAWTAALIAETQQATHAAAHAEHTARTQAITECQLCNDDGYRGSTVCDHIDRTETARNGAAQVRAALRRTKIKVAPSGDEPF